MVDMGAEDRGQDNARPIVDRRNQNVVRTILVGVTAPLIVAIIGGYVAAHTQITRLSILAEQAQKQLTALELDYRGHNKEYQELQALVLKQGIVIEHIYKDVTDLKNDNKVVMQHLPRLYQQREK